MVLSKTGIISAATLLIPALLTPVAQAQPPERRAASAQTSTKPAPSNPGLAELPAGAIMRFGANRFRLENGTPRALAFSRDGKNLLAIPESGVALYIWEAESGRLIRKIELPRLGRPGAVALSTHGSQLAFLKE